MDKVDGAVSGTIGRECSRAEEELKQFAGLLYMLHLITSYLRTVTTLWASLVILSGFGNALAIRDFWFSTAVLLLNKMSIFNTKYHVDDIIIDDSSTTPPHSPAPRRPKGGILTYIRRKGRDLYKAINPRLFPLWRILIMLIIMVKLTAAMYLCINTFMVPARVLVASGEDRNTTIARNKKYSLVVLYVLVSCECFLFLVEDLYYLYKVYLCNQLCRLSEELEFGKSNTRPVRGFLFDSISSRDSTRDMVTFAVDLLASNSREKQLVGVRIIENFSKKLMLSREVLRNIGDNLTALNSLGRMLRWELPEDKENRISAATVLTNLAKEKENALRIATILGPIKSISYLFESPEKNDVSFVDLGLRIIEELAHDQDECEKIGKTKSLLDKLVALTKTINYDKETTVEEGQGKTQEKLLVRFRNKEKYSRLRKENDTTDQEGSSSPQERCLKVLKLVTTQRGATWKTFHREISSTNLVKNIRDILLVTAGGRIIKKQKLGIQVLANLAQEKHAKEHVGATEGVLEALLNIFFSPVLKDDEEEEELRCNAGKALEYLALKSKGNCLRILRLENKRFEVGLSSDESLGFRLSAGRVLLYLCTYGGPNFQLQTLLRSISAMVLKGVFDKDGALQDLMVEIAGFSFKLVTNLNDWIKLCELAGVNEATLGCELKQILMRHKYDISMKHSSNICTSIVELALWMIRIDPRNVHTLRELGMNRELKDILETTPKIEEAIALLENAEIRSNLEDTYLTSPTSS